MYVIQYERFGGGWTRVMKHDALDAAMEECKKLAEKFTNIPRWRIVRVVEIVYITPT